MSAAVVASDVLAGLATVVVVASCLGVAVMPEVLQKLHYVTPIGMVAPTLLAASITCKEGWSNQATSAWVVAVVLAVASPVLGHATGAAIRAREELRR
ncbi:MAG TPA: monovalent cation/H(+) antiporter subunit G [Acidimicrobiales bacterium]|nr:monovalent cation/H(+) antiporter subunit G [Acidimicrobiales bacterium]